MNRWMNGYVCIHICASQFLKDRSKNDVLRDYGYNITLVAVASWRYFYQFICDLNNLYGIYIL